MPYALMYTPREGRHSYMQLIDGCAHFTSLDLADQHPSLVKSWKTEAAAKAVCTRMLKRYPDKYIGERSDYHVVPWP